MNWVDLVILGTIALVALSGLRSGLLVPVAGVGGLALGVVFAVQYHGELAFALTEHVDGEVVRRVAAFAAIVLGTVIAARFAASMLKKLLSFLVLGWVDRVAGLLAGTALAIVALGTASYLLQGMEATALNDPFQRSTLAVPISSASLIRTSAPWCDDLHPIAAKDRIEAATLVQGASAVGQECTTLRGIADQLLAGSISDKLGGLLGHDVGEIAELVKTSLSESAGGPTDVVQAQAQQ